MTPNSEPSFPEREVMKILILCDFDGTITTRESRREQLRFLLFFVLGSLKKGLNIDDVFLFS
jgi:2-hydroxy-3-keto-5-methylthiopentenyl-1-phosphate phosphatase